MKKEQLQALLRMKELLPQLKNYTITLLLFLLLDNENLEVPKRYTQKQLLVLTGLSSMSLQRGMHELEDLNILTLEFVRNDGNYKHCPEFLITLD